jgi:hypothetical protein
MIRVAAAFPDGTDMPEGFSVPYTSVDAALVESGVGALTLEVPTEVVPQGLGRDYQLRLYRTAYGGFERLEGEAVWLIRRREFSARDDGLETSIFTALHANSLVDRRIVAYGTGSTQSRQSGALDNIVKQLVRDNFIGATDTDRNVSGLTVEANTALAPSATVQVAYQPLGQVIRDLCEASREAGTYLGFDVRASGASLLFRTFVGQRGVDRGFSSGNILLFGRQFGNVSSITIEEDWEEAATIAYAVGPGEGPLRPAITARVAADELGSPFGRIEALATGSGRTSVELAHDAAAAIMQLGYRLSVDAVAVDSDACIYGRDYSWGDRVVVVEDNVHYEVMVDPVRITASVSGDSYDEKIEAKLSYRG